MEMLILGFGLETGDSLLKIRAELCFPFSVRPFMQRSFQINYSHENKYEVGMKY